VVLNLLYSIDRNLFKVFEALPTSTYSGRFIEMGLAEIFLLLDEQLDV